MYAMNEILHFTIKVVSSNYDNYLGRNTAKKTMLGKGHCAASFR